MTDTEILNGVFDSDRLFPSGAIVLGGNCFTQGSNTTGAVITDGISVYANDTVDSWFKAIVPLSTSLTFYGTTKYLTITQIDIVWYQNVNNVGCYLDELVIYIKSSTNGDSYQTVYSSTTNREASTTPGYKTFSITADLMSNNTTTATYTTPLIFIRYAKASAATDWALSWVKITYSYT